MNLVDMFARRPLCCFAVFGLVGLLSFFKPPEDPEKALQHFAALFKAQDAAGIYKLLNPEIVTGKEIEPQDVASFLKRYRSNTLIPQQTHVDKRFKSEDGETERFQATIEFQGPVLLPQYPAPSRLTMVLLWVLENGTWWLERPLSINYVVSSTAEYPTLEQQELALRLEATLGILEKVGLPGTEDVAFAQTPLAGVAEEQLKELERLYPQERGAAGIDPKARGVEVLLDAAQRTNGGFLRIYRRDFESDPGNVRRPVPWDMFRDYVNAALKLAKIFEARGKTQRAEGIYRRVIALGRQLLDEQGGYQYVTWGLTFQRQGAVELSRLFATTKNPLQEKVLAFANLASRRLDLLQTGLTCLDDMTDYRSLKAAVIAAAREGDAVFRPWGINTLTILALKGAPASAEAIKNAGAMVVVDNPAMKRIAQTELDRLASQPSGSLKAFVENQAKWIAQHEVYGTVQSFR